jgi:pimeloyl-ACP methyl ester carboxylesterase
MPIKLLTIARLGLVLAATAAPLAALAQPAPIEERLVEADGYLLNVKILRGEPDAPTIVLESGGGFDSRQWAKLQPQLAAETGASVVAYDRPGYGKSPLPTKPYDIADESRAFHDALVQLKLADHVLLVGHSYGGLLIQLYAGRWPDTVKGMLFLDPVSPAAMLAMGSAVDDRPLPNPTTPNQRANNRLDEAGRAKFAPVYAAVLPLSIPVVVVSAETPPFRDPRQIAVFGLSHQLLAASVSDGKRVIAEHSNHMIPDQRPDIVIEQTKALLAKSR